MNLRTLLFFLLLLVNLCSADEIIPGLQYEHLIQTDPSQSIHLLIADPNHIEISIGIADNKCASAQKTTSIAQQYDAIAAINAGFFDFCCKHKFQDFFIKFLDCFGYSNYKAYPLWTLNIANQYYSLSSIFIGAIAWNSVDQKPLFSAIKTTPQLKINGINIAVTGFNKPNQQGITLFTATYDTQTPYSRTTIDEVVIEDGIVISIVKASHGKTVIPQNGAVLAFSKAQKQLSEMVEIENRVDLQIIHEHKSDLLTPPSEDIWNSMDNILASTPLLIQNGTIPPYIFTFKSGFYTKPHPRTALGVRADGQWVFVVADGRQKHAKGLTILELTHLLQKLGCTNALNLDGGGSSTMVINNKIINVPSGREYGLSRHERLISNGIVLKKK